MEMIHPYRRYSDYMKELYGKRVQKITVDAGFTCPNRDGTKAYGGCIYCNNESFAPGHKSTLSISEQIHFHKKKLATRYNASQYLVYFQAYSNTYSSLEHLKKLYEEALAVPGVVGLSIGTRADCVDQAKLDYLGELAQKYDITIEYGLESMDNESLKRMNRGHSYQDFCFAVEQSHQRGIKTCAHLILGFPWENKELWLKTADELSRLKVTFLKLHQLHIVKGTVLAEQYLAQPFPLMTQMEYRDLVIEFLERLSSEVVIQRLVGEAHAQTLLAPNWNVRSSDFTEDLERQMLALSTYQGRLCQSIEAV